MKKIIGSKNGDGYIEIVVIVIAAMMSVIILINVISLVITEQQLEYFSRELLISASANGGIVDKTNLRFVELCDEVGFTPEMDSDGTNFISSSSGKVQLGEKIAITLTYETKVAGLGVISIPISLKKSGSGISEKYWK